MNRKLIIAALLAGLLASCSGASAQQPRAYALFAEDTPLALRITAPLRQLARDAPDRPEHDALVEIVGPGAQAAALDVEIRIRGNSRLRECDFPPLSIDFPRSRSDGTVFAGQDRLKLVTLCRRTGGYRDYLAKEFLIYRLFGALTDHSFRVRWAEVEFVEADARRPRPFVEPAFLIEADWQAAERLGLDLIERDRLGIESLDAAHAARLALFQYMIGNTDWAFVRGPDGEPCCHNGKAIGSPEGPVFILPYDFDQAGLVDAEYAVPSETLPIRVVTQRLYRGFCALNGEIAAAVEHLNARREAMESVLDDALVREGARRRALDYLRESFERINDEDRLRSDVLERCR